MTERLNWEHLRGAFDAYARARQKLLETIGVSGSNRDPLAEFSERLVAALLGGELATNRVQRGWDVLADGRHVQVKYLANWSMHSTCVLTGWPCSEPSPRSDRSGSWRPLRICRSTLIFRWAKHARTRG